MDRYFEPPPTDLTTLTLRDYFAAKAMHALITEPPWGTDDPEAAVHSLLPTGFRGDYAEMMAAGAYRMADAMLKAREA